MRLGGMVWGGAFLWAAVAPEAPNWSNVVITGLTAAMVFWEARRKSADLERRLRESNARNRRCVRRMASTEARLAEALAILTKTQAELWANTAVNSLFVDGLTQDPARLLEHLKRNPEKLAEIARRLPPRTAGSAGSGTDLLRGTMPSL